MNLLSSPSNQDESIAEESARKQLNSLKKTLYTIAAIVVSVFLIFGFGWFKGRASNKEIITNLEEELQRLIDTPVVIDPITPEISLKVIETEIKEIGELATTEYLYTNAAKFSDSRQIFNWNIPLTEKAFVMKWSGVIKAGIDVQKIETQLNEKTKLIVIHLPKAEILSHDPDKDSVEVLDEKNGLFNAVTVEDQIKFDAACEKEMDQRAIESGLLEKAEENAKNIISKVLNSIPGVDGIYTIEFVG